MAVPSEELFPFRRSSSFTATFWYGSGEDTFVCCGGGGGGGGGRLCGMSLKVLVDRCKIMSALHGSLIASHTTSEDLSFFGKGGGGGGGSRGGGGGRGGGDLGAESASGIPSSMLCCWMLIGTPGSCDVLTAALGFSGWSIRRGRGGGGGRGGGLVRSDCCKDAIMANHFSPSRVTVKTFGIPYGEIFSEKFSIFDISTKNI